MKFSYDAFLKNIYTKWYIQLIQTRQFNPPIPGETESHHIFPTSIFGKNKFTVNLTYREHFVAHLLLSKMFTMGSPSHTKMIIAVHCLTLPSSEYNKRPCYKPSSRIFEMLKKSAYIVRSENSKAMWQNDETRAKLTKHRQEYWGQEVNRKAQSDRRKEHFTDEENRKQMIEINKEIASRPEWRKQRSEKQKQFSSDPEYTKYRIDAMNRPESKQKSIESKRKTIENMTPEEKKAKYGGNKGRFWITNGTESTLHTQSVEIPNGWYRGRTIPPR